MKTVKMSLANLQDKMSRKEMKNIMAGSGNCTCTPSCGGGETCKKSYSLGICTCQKTYA